MLTILGYLFLLLLNSISLAIIVADSNGNFGIEDWMRPFTYLFIIIVAILDYSLILPHL